MSETTQKVVLPWFTVENAEFPWLGLGEMSDMLRRGGFTVTQIFDTEGQLFSLLANPPPNRVRFEIILPAGWSLANGYNGYGSEEYDLRHLLDKKGQLRGHVVDDGDREHGEA